MKAFYNEIDQQCCAWLSNLMDAGLITPGVICDRSIEDIAPRSLLRYDRVHMFAGIAGWELALKLAGWRHEPGVRVWTGSCPCQPFSSAGKGDGFADQRHLWPAWFHLIRQCRPEFVFGEQVASAIRHGWLDLVSADMEAEGYAVGASVLGAHSVGGPHIGNRLYWVAATHGAGCAWQGSPQSERRRGDFVIPWSFATSRGSDGRVRAVDARPCSMGHGVSARVALNRAYGNAIVPQTAAAFIRASMTGEIQKDIAA